MDDGTERPIAFASRSLTKAEKGYSQIDKEALALYWGVLKFHTYSYGRHFTLVTDHKPLVSILNPNTGIPAMTAARLQRYALYLAGHTYDIEHRNTKQHCNADGLSRLPLTTQIDDYTDTASVYYNVTNGTVTSYEYSDPQRNASGSDSFSCVRKRDTWPEQSAKRGTVQTVSQPIS